ncbi:MAG: dioxygenase [Acidimicrobiales bacterium]
MLKRTADAEQREQNRENRTDKEPDMSGANVAPELPSSEELITSQVLHSFDNVPSPRFKEVIKALVTHLHAFEREVRLTTGEWEAAIAFLTRAGQMTTAQRQEFILASDVLGLSSLTVAINAPKDSRATEATVLGPFYLPDSPEISLGDDLAAGAEGTPCWVGGRVLSTDGSPIAGAILEIWEADENGFYDVQYEGGKTAARGSMRSGPGGEYRFWSVRPAPYPIPCDGPVGDLLRAAGRSPMRPAHIHIRAQAPGYRSLVTHIFLAGDDHLYSDAVFGVKESLITEVVEHPPSVAPDGSQLAQPWVSLAFDVVLCPETTAKDLRR